MNEPELQIFNLGSPLIHHYLFRNNDKRIDKTLLYGIAGALEEAGIPARERPERLYINEHSTRFNQVHTFIAANAAEVAETPQELMEVAVSA